MLDMLPEKLRHFPVEVVYIFLAISGGVARSLNSYNNNGKFAFSHFLASIFVSGFSGWMFSLLGQSLSLPQTFIFMMSGIGGFMGEQALKFLADYITKKIK